MLPAVILAAVYLIWAPPSADLAAQTFRSDLFDANGFQVWSNAWYGGFHLPGYSLLFPPLASVLGVRLVGAVSVVAATWCFAAIVRPRFGDRARVAIFLFGLGSATNLFTGRLTFALGVAVGMAAVLAVDRQKPAAGGALALLSGWASPVAGLFTAFAGAVLFVRGRRLEGAALAGPALAGILAVVMLFPTGGMHPFSVQTFLLISGATLILLVALPRGATTLRVGAAMYLAFCLAVFLIDSPVGGNSTRLGALMAAPLLALGAWGRRPAWMVGLALLPLVYWQWVAPVRDLADAVGEPSVEEAYYAPLLGELDARAPSEPFRVQVPPTRNRWEAVYVAERFPLARGWLRQLESDDFELFQDGNLTADSYREWLDERSVAFVAISTGAVQDYLSEDEGDLINGGLPYLEEVWSNENWELYEVEDPSPISEPPVEVTELTDQGFVAEGAGEGEALVRVRWSPYFEVVEGDASLAESEDGWTLVDVERSGPVVVETRFP